MQIFRGFAATSGCYGCLFLLVLQGRHSVVVSLALCCLSLDVQARCKSCMPVQLSRSLGLTPRSLSHVRKYLALSQFQFFTFLELFSLCVPILVRVSSWCVGLLSLGGECVV